MAACTLSSGAAAQLNNMAPGSACWLTAFERGAGGAAAHVVLGAVAVGAAPVLERAAHSSPKSLTRTD